MSPPAGSPAAFQTPTRGNIVCDKPASIGLQVMTPADLSQLIRAVAVDYFTEQQLDISVLPQEVTVERPRNPEHGDYATNVALQVAKKV